MRLKDPVPPRVGLPRTRQADGEVRLSVFPLRVACLRKPMAV